VAGRIFISYRRDDERSVVGRLLSALQLSFASEQLFADADPVAPGDDVVRTLNTRISRSKVLVAIIGPRWLSASDTRGAGRLDNPVDVVRVAIEAALRQGKRIIPVLVGDAEMPTAEQLPESLRPLATLSPLRIGSTNVQADCQGLVRTLTDLVGRWAHGWVIWPIILVGIELIAIGVVIMQWQNIRGYVRGMFTAPSQQQAQRFPADSPQDKPKIADRPGQPPVAGSERAVLYEEDKTDPQGQRFLGVVVWRFDPAAASNDQADASIHADIAIPDRKLKLTIVIHRNHDAALPASHVMDLKFVLPFDFPGGGIDSVPGILMKSSEPARGVPFAARTVRVTDGFFLIGFSNVEADRVRNIQALKDGEWFDLPIVYGNRRRAIIAVAKGKSGERAFNDAFAAWGQ